MPEVSICLPVLNTRKFLPERIQSIKDQTFQNWECIVSDNYSEDGSWEYLNEVCGNDPRFFLRQANKNGMYNNWNQCLTTANGQYLYFATSDDTMKPDCIEKLLQGFAEKPHASIMSSIPWIIDENGKELESGGTGDIERKMSAINSATQLMNIFDLVCGALFRRRTPALSMTQLLIKKEVFEDISYLPETFGSMGDWAWQLLTLANVKWGFVPYQLGSWRRHSEQATAHALEDHNYYFEMEKKMVQWVLGNKKFKNQHLLPLFGYWMASKNLKIDSHSLGLILGSFFFSLGKRMPFFKRY